jgi:hypothetical protein
MLIFSKKLNFALIFIQNRRAYMASLDEQVLRATKEIVVKFIEGGRISPAGFPDSFINIYSTVHDTVKGHATRPPSDEEQAE